MQKLNADRVEISPACPHCGKQTTTTIGQARANPQWTCEACGGLVEFDLQQLDEGLRAADKALANFRKGLGRYK